jgi:hypothetical protein
MTHHILDEYKLDLKYLGKGGFGTVYAASTPDKRRVAIKIMF